MSDPIDTIYAKNGAVGIGTNNPQEKLHVDGNMTVSGLAYASEFRKLDGTSISPVTQIFNLTETQKLLASDGGNGDEFGNSVAMSNNYAIVGAHEDESKGENAGAAYIFERDSNDNWNQKPKLLASDGAADHFFGHSVAISDNYAIVGAWGHSSRAGAAYVFERDTNGNWTQKTKLFAPNGEDNDRFGHSVAISGNYAIIGALRDDDKGGDAGAAYVFERGNDGNWTQKTKLLALDGKNYDYFGASAVISGNYVIVGALGAAYIFERDSNGNWNQKTKLLASDGGASDQFGRTVAISGNYAIIAAHRDDDKGSDAGAAYVFERDTNGNWNQKIKLLASDGVASDQFGWSVAISGNYAIVGAYEYHNASNAGAAYVFERDSNGYWNQKTKLLASDGGASDQFGRAVAISSNYAIVGASNENTAGAAYIFEQKSVGTSRTQIRDNHSIGFYTVTGTDHTLKMIVNSSGYVGIGTNNPQEKLHVDGNITVSGLAYASEFRKLDGTSISPVIPVTQIFKQTETQKLLASDGGNGDEFGHSVAISGNYAIVGAHYDDGKGIDAGAAYVFERGNDGNWNQKTKLFALDASDYDEFGWSVAISGNYAIVGAYHDAGSKGAAYIFERDSDGNWGTHPPLGLMTYRNENQKLVALDGAPTDRFGYSVAISNNYAIVGAYLDDTERGSAYIFERGNDDNWNQKTKLFASDGVDHDQFGYSVAISGNYAIVGAWGYDLGTSYDIGKAFIFERDSNGNWNKKTKLVASDGAAYHYFGGSVAISGNYAIIGAHRDGDKGSDAGAAYIFERDNNGNWGTAVIGQTYRTEKTKLLASDGACSDYFGISAAISGNYAFVGASKDDDNGEDAGAVYVFERDSNGNWNQKTKLLASDGAASDRFGYSLAISNNYAIVGAFYDDTERGSAYIIENKSVGILVDGIAYASEFRKLDGTSIPVTQIFNLTETQKLLASDVGNGDQFGNSVAMSNNYAIVGAYYDDDKGTDAGAAYIFERASNGNWTQKTKLLASDGATYDKFGVSVAISGNYAIVGADGKNNSIGAAYIFERDNNGNWGSNGNETQKLLASYGGNGDKFGITVAISGNYAIVGALKNDNLWGDAGAAYIFEHDCNGNWGNNGNETQKLLAYDGSIRKYFGSSVAISGNYAIIGAWYEDGIKKGSAYIFERERVSDGNWTQKTKLLASDGGNGDKFGITVAISGNYAIVGASADDDKGTDAGAAYIFERDNNGNWGTAVTGQTYRNENQKLLASGVGASDEFGITVAISGNYAIIGAIRDDDKGGDAGAAYIFERDNNGNWSQIQKLLASNGGYNDLFGKSVAISGNYAIVGASNKNNGFGSAYIFEDKPAILLNNDTWTTNSYTKILGDTTNGRKAIWWYFNNSPSGTQIRDNHSIGFYTGGSTGADHTLKMIVNSSGYVGIGTTSPLAPLQVKTTEVGKGIFLYDENGIIFKVARGSGPSNPYISMYTNSGGTQTVTIKTNGNTYFNGGNVGIGTTSPVSKLQVVGEARFKTHTYTSHVGFSTNGDIYWRSGKAAGKVILQDTGGRVGIGTASPDYTLHVATGFPSWIENKYVYDSGRNRSYLKWSDRTSGMLTISIKANQYIWGQGFIHSSDERIKKNIIDVPDNLSLEMVRNIPCRYYEYIDNIKRGDDKTIGFIAQEVKEVMPMAVGFQTDYIPNEMRKLTDMSWNNTTLYTDLSDCSGIKYKFYVSNDLSGNYEKEVVGNADNSFTFDQSYNNVFCYGKQVDDFHTVDKDKLFALNFSATQEIDRIQQQQLLDISGNTLGIQSNKNELELLKLENQELTNKVTALETELNNLKTIVESLVNNN